MSHVNDKYDFYTFVCKATLWSWCVATSITVANTHTPYSVVAKVRSLTVTAKGNCSNLISAFIGGSIESAQCACHQRLIAAVVKN